MRITISTGMNCFIFTFQLFCTAIFCILMRCQDSEALDSYRRNSMNNYQDEEPMNPTDKEKLSKIYGHEVVDAHRSDFVHVGRIGEHQQPIAHPRPPPIEMSKEYRQNQLDEVHLVQNQPLTPAFVKKLLHELLERLEYLEDSEKNIEGVESPALGSRCSLQGLWISAITGVAFQLEPIQGGGPHYELHVQVVDSGDRRSHPETQFITSEWTGTAQVSTESPTTISIILQERIPEPEVEPKTAVFIGQCVVCSGSPTIQGTWILFPKNQICFQETTRPPQADVMYLLTR